MRPFRPRLRSAALALAALLPLSVGAAQESVFGTLGFGLPEDGLSVRSRGMGNVTTALPRIQFAFRNPAGLAVFDRTGISAASLLQVRSAEDASAESRQTSAEIPFLQLAFPIGSGVVLGAGTYRYLDFDGFVDTATPFRGDSLPMRLTTQGGLSVLTPLLAWRPVPGVRVGAGADFYTGSRKVRRRVDFPEDVAVSTSDSVTFDLGATGFSLGLQVAPLPQVLLGAGYRSGVTLEGDLRIGPGLEGDDDEVDDVAEIELPPSLYLGASYRLDTRLTVAGELETSRWGDFRIDGVPEETYGDVVGGGLGAEYAFPDEVLFLPEGTVLRAGVRARTLPQRFGGEKVHERAASLGFGQVVGIGASVLDLALEAGRRGDVEENGIAESFVRLGISLSAFEQWVSREPRDPGE